MAVDLSSELLLRWDGAAPEQVPLFKIGGVTVLWTNKHNAALDQACGMEGIRVLGSHDVQLLAPARLGEAAADAAVIVKDGVWSGASMPKKEPAAVAGASVRPWVRANGSLIGYLRAMYSDRPPILGYSPDADAGLKPDKPPALSSLELALIDAWAAGGNYVLTLTPEHRQDLLRAKREALSAWRGIGRTARWLRRHRALFRFPTMPNITLLVESGDTTAELANLLYRENASPRLVNAANPPPPDPRSCAVLVAAGIRPPDVGIADRILAHAEAGATVVTDAGDARPWWRRPSWKPAQTFEDRSFYTAGRGRLVVYQEEIQDPGDFALDVIDLAGQSRPLRLWDNGAVVALNARSGEGGNVLRAVNYGPPLSSWSVLAQVPGRFSKATLLRPESEPVALRLAPRGEFTEVAIPSLNLLAVVEFA